MTTHPAKPEFDDADRDAVIRLMRDIQTKHGYSAGDTWGLLHTLAFFTEAVSSSLTIHMSEATGTRLTPGWFSPLRAGHTVAASKHLDEAIESLSEAARKETPE